MKFVGALLLSASFLILSVSCQTTNTANNQVKESEQESGPGQHSRNLDWLSVSIEGRCITSDRDDYVFPSRRCYTQREFDHQFEGTTDAELADEVFAIVNAAFQEKYPSLEAKDLSCINWQSIMIEGRCITSSTPDYVFPDRKCYTQAEQNHDYEGSTDIQISNEANKVRADALRNKVGVSFYSSMPQCR